MVKMNFFQKYWKAVVQLVLLYAFTVGGIFWGLLFTDIREGGYKTAWWATLLRSFSLVTLPTAVLIFCGMTLPPLPVEKDKITDYETQIAIRWTTRGTYPVLVQDVIQKSFQALKDQSNYRLEVVTESSVLVMETYENIPEDMYQEMIIPKDYKCPNGSLYKARGLVYGAVNSKCQPNAYILHLDEESIVTEELYLGVRQFISQHKGFIGQGVITYANVNSNWQSYFCHLQDSMRTGDDFARFRFQCLIGKCLIGMKGSYMVVPNELEQTVGFDHGPRSSITEDAWSALLHWDKLRFCRGMLVEQSPFTIRDIIKQRRRWASGLWLLVIYHPAAWWKKTVLFMQMIAWIMSPLVAVSFVASFVLFQYKMPVYLGVPLGFIFAMFNFQYVWGALHHVHGSYFSKFLHVICVPFVLPIFMVVEGIAGVYGTVWPVSGFPLVEKQAESLCASSVGRRTPASSSNDLVGMAGGHVVSSNDLVALGGVIAENESEVVVSHGEENV